MKFPLGPIIRALWPGTWIGKIFSKTEGVSIKVGDHEILLDQKHGGPSSSSAPFDRPHTPAPPPRR